MRKRQVCRAAVERRERAAPEFGRISPYWLFYHSKKKMCIIFDEPVNILGMKNRQSSVNCRFFRICTPISPGSVSAGIWRADEEANVRETFLLRETWVRLPQQAGKSSKRVGRSGKNAAMQREGETRPLRDRMIPGKVWNKRFHPPQSVTFTIHHKSFIIHALPEPAAPRIYSPRGGLPRLTFLKKPGKIFLTMR